MHPLLVRLGFLRYIELRGGAPSDLLFHDQRDAEKGARNLSRSFLELRTDLDLRRPTLDFHSLRHSARTMLAALGGLEEHLDLIFGHEDAAKRDHVRETYKKDVWDRSVAESLATLTYGIAAFAEDVAVLEQMRRDGFLLMR